jgi:hypothetical protein
MCRASKPPLTAGAQVRALLRDREVSHKPSMEPKTAEEREMPPRIPQDRRGALPATSRTTPGRE